MNDFLKQFFRTPGNSSSPDSSGGSGNAAESGRTAEGSEQPNRDDEFIKEQFTTHQRLTSSITTAETERKQSEELASALNLHAVQFCKRLSEENPQLHLAVSEAARVAEPAGWLSKQDGRKSDAPTHFYRWKVRGNTQILSVRASRGQVAFYLVPDKEVPHITMSEFGSRYRGSFRLTTSENGLVWTRNKVRISADQALHFLEKLLIELAADKNRPAENAAASQGPPQFAASTEQKLELEKNNLLFKLLNQQEEMKGQLGRDLHDSVIADLMMLKRYLSGDKKISVDETIEIIDEVVLHLRDIVNDYSPRQLQEWGLKVGIEDLLDRTARRTGMECNFKQAGELPKLPELVSLHLFRLVQECLNNIEKHAGASTVSVDIDASPGGTSTFKVSDNGCGFDPSAIQRDSEGMQSLGLEGMRERVELIKCFYQCRLDIASTPGQGTTITIAFTVE